MRAGELRDPIDIIRSSRTVDNRGGGVPTWSVITDGSRWAKVTSSGGRERYAGLQLEDTEVLEVKMRYLAGVTSADRVRWNSRTLEIAGLVDWGNRHVEMSLFCIEHKAGA